MNSFSPRLRSLAAFVLFILCVSFSTYAQVRIPKGLVSILAPLPQPEEFVLTTCSSVGLDGCNYIRNNNFTPDALYDPNSNSSFDNPFNYNNTGQSLVANYIIAVGTPQIYDGVHATNGANSTAPPPGTTGHFFAGVGYTSQVGGYYSEGVVQKIPALSTAKTYVMSFYKAFKDYTTVTGVNTNHPVDHFRIVLMKCSDYNQTFIPISYQLPALPTNSQVIYCETTVNNVPWDQVLIKFTPTQNFDMIYIIPEGNQGDQSRNSGLYFSFPELIDVTNFSAGTIPTPIPTDCMITLGPTTPNCVPTGAVLTWHGPNGQAIVAPASQQIQVDASAIGNPGTWTLAMTMPNAVTTNNTCSQQQVGGQAMITATIVVPACSTCSTTPQVLSSSFFSVECNPAIPNRAIIPNSFNFFCTPWECGGRVNLESNYSSGNEWYINNVYIGDGTSPIGIGGHVPNIGFVEVINNSKKLRHSLSTYSNAQQEFVYSFKNCNVTTPSTTVFWGQTFHATEWLGFYKPNFTKNISTYLNYTFGAGSIYTWSIPNAIVTDITNTDPQASVYFPSNIPIPTVTGTLTVSNSPYCNGVYNIEFTYDPNAKPSKEAVLQNNSEIKIYPNPASSQVTLRSEDDFIRSVEINAFFTPAIKKMTGNNTRKITLDVSLLQRGVYNCKIITTKGITYKKLFITR